MKTKFLVIITLMLALAPAWAQSAISLPIQSQDQVREFALKNVVRGFRSVWSESLDWNDPDKIIYAEVSGNGAENVLNGLFAAELRYKLTNPLDKIRGYVYLYDKFDTLLFYGYAEYTAADLTKGKPQYGIWIQNIPMLRNVSAAEVLVTGEDGVTVNRIQLEVDDHGRLLFQAWMAGAPNGILSVRFTDGSLATYRLEDPVAQTPSQTYEGASDWKIEGHYVFGSGKVNITEAWVRPTALVRLASQQTLTIDVMGLVQEDGKTYFERPTAMIVTLEDGTEGTVSLNTDGPTDFENVRAGDYRLRFVWDKFGQPNTLYTGPY
ncbi:MAG: hypothetical protein V4699_01100 [Patescibacteria group bacterium]